MAPAPLSYPYSGMSTFSVFVSIYFTRNSHVKIGAGQRKAIIGVDDRYAENWPVYCLTKMLNFAVTLAMRALIVEASLPYHLTTRMIITYQGSRL